MLCLCCRMRRTRSYTVVKATDSEGAIVNKRVVSPTDSDAAGDIALQNIDPKRMIVLCLCVSVFKCVYVCVYMFIVCMFQN